MASMAFSCTYCTTPIATSQIAGITEIPMLILEIFLSLCESADILRFFHKSLIVIFFDELFLLISFNSLILCTLLFLWLFLNFFNSLTSFKGSPDLLILLIILSFLSCFNNLLTAIFQLFILYFWKSLLTKLAEIVQDL